MIEDDATPSEDIVNVAVVALAGTVTVTGTEAFVLSVDKETVAPPFGAARFSVIVPVVLLPPTMVFGEIEIPCNRGL